MGAEISITESEPTRAAVLFEHRTCLPRFVAEAPTGVGVDGPGEGVGHGVEVGRDVQPVQNEVITHVDDRRHLGSVDDFEQCAQHSSRTDAAGDDGDHEIQAWSRW